MRELLDLLDVAKRLDASNEPYVVATVVSTSGSTYRSVGARQLISATTSVGTVSGGCLASQIQVAAEGVMRTGQSIISVYDLTKDDDLVWGWGLGCSGITEVLFETAESFRELAEALRAGLGADETVSQVTMLGHKLGERVVYTPGELEEQIGPMPDDVATWLTKIEGVRAFVEVIRPPNRLVISGANNDARPLVEAAAALGWRSIVIDPRSGLLTTDRFEKADMLISAEPSAMGGVVELDSRTFVVLMNHHFLRDGDALTAVLGSDVAYIGLLGPAERAQQLLKYAADQGAVATDDDMAKMHGPAGLDIGAEGPLEIAWSIMSEAMAVAAGRAGGSMRD